jgi:putative peptidoglycan binding protein
MMIVKLGERGPRVVLVQILLNRADSAPPLTVDGKFGPKTLDAVTAFQRRPGLGLTASGVVDPATWKRLPRGSNMEVVDVVDVGDPNIGGKTVQAFQAAGGDSIELGLMCNGVGQMITSASGSAKAHSVGLFRIVGHGNKGRWLTASVGDVVDSPPEWQAVLASEDHSYINADNIDVLAPILAPLKSRFAPYGCAEHGGCSLGSVEKTRGVLHKLANLWNVPVTVGIGLQRSYLHFDGPTFTAYPSSGTLESWSTQFQNADF